MKTLTLLLITTLISLNAFADEEQEQTNAPTQKTIHLELQLTGMLSPKLFTTNTPFKSRVNCIENTFLQKDGPHMKVSLNGKLLAKMPTESKETCLKFVEEFSVRAVNLLLPKLTFSNINSDGVYTEILVTYEYGE